MKKKKANKHCMHKNNNSPSGFGRKKHKKTKFEPNTDYVILKIATKPTTAFGSQFLTQDRMMFLPKSADDAVLFFQQVIANTQQRPDIKEKMLALSIDDFMKEFSDSFNGGTFVPFHSTTSFVEKMIELEIFRKAVLQ